MANRIFDNVIQVDSSMGNLPIVGGSSSNLLSFSVIGISFTATTTLGSCLITAANTLDIVAEFGFLGVATNMGLMSALQSITFSRPLELGTIKCPTLTAGSARIYLS